MKLNSKMKMIFAILFVFTGAVTHATGNGEVGSVGQKQNPVYGLNCDQRTQFGRDSKNIIAFRPLNGGKIALVVKDAFRDPLMEGNGEIRMIVTVQAIQPILNDDLIKMDKKTLGSPNTSITFDVDGADFTGKPRLRATIKNDLTQFRLSNCIVQRAPVIGF